MKKILISLLVLFALTGCDFNINGSVDDNGGNNSQNDANVEKNNIDYKLYVPTGYEYITSHTKEIQMNGKKHILGYVYFVEKSDNISGLDCSIILDGKYIKTVKVSSKDVEYTNEQYKAQVTKEFATKEFEESVIKDKQNSKEYLSINLMVKEISGNGNTYNVLVVDDNGLNVYENTYTIGTITEKSTGNVVKMYDAESDQIILLGTVKGENNNHTIEMISFSMENGSKKILTVKTLDLSIDGPYIISGAL